MAADRGDTAGQGVERVSGVRLTEGELKALRAAFDRDVWAGEWNGLPTAADRILATRLAPVEALAAEWDDDLDSGRIRDLDARYCWNTALTELRGALTPPTAAPSPDREPGPTPSEES